MNDLPNPLTPADCDLRNFREMPIDVPRLLGSDLVHDESPEACWSAMLLWCVSWHEVPAGSMPDNDEWLAKRAGYWHKGKLDPTWHDVRDGALHGWIKCSDGRLYHPVLAEKVNASWFSKHRHAHDKLGERIRKRNKGRPENGLPVLDVPELDAWIEMGRPLERDLFPLEFSTPSSGNEKTSGGKRSASGGSADDIHRKASAFPPNDRGSSAGIPPENALNRAERNGIEHVNHSGGGTAQAVADDAQNAAAAFVEILRSSGIGFAADDERVRSWPALGATPIDLRTAIQVGLLRRKREGSAQPLNIGLLNSLLPEAIAQRTGRVGAAASGAAAGPWHTTWPGIVEHGRTLGLEQGEHETCPDFKLRVLRAAGDGPWWDEHNRAFRNSAGPVAAGSILEAGR
ncbi:YdaU family protein [Burkholderia cenocepacia]|uniref:YdaU family protein n=1 Tax=Burkholderia cenocepacia TaxID=95486 RepID=UPI001FC82D7C|nr:YdaU family protein [Burkholderia cenocepacia]